MKSKDSVLEATRSFDVAMHAPAGTASFSEIQLEVRRRGAVEPLGRAVLVAPESATPAEPPDADDAARRTGVLVASWFVAPDAPACATALLAYAALREARTSRRTTVFARAEGVDERLTKLLGMKPLVKGAPLHVGARVDMGLARSAAACAREGEPLLPAFLASEVIAAVYAFVGRIYASGFFRAVDDGTLSREQYVHMLGQTHQYVRYTTRILGRCVAHSDSTELRSHFIKHLTGEVNHEMIIERDLAHLGEDPVFVRDEMAPNGPTAQFTLAELALISHFQDPYLLTAAPLAAEGMSAHLSRAWIDRLNGIIAGWGVERPELASRFLSSHIDFDSGDDGHWEGSVQMLAHYLVDERRLARFLGALAACTDALERSYAAAVDDMALWR